MFAQLLVSATSSGCGKTTFTLGLMRALTRRGLDVSGFKCGPDYIDPKFHHLATGRESINLDLYMMSREHTQTVYARHTKAADVAVVEGVMGLFDGSRKMEGSSAEVAKLLGLPVILLVNAASSAYSVGASIYGYKHWQKGLNIVGVVFNRVASENHYQFLKDAATDAGVESLGYIPKTNALDVPSRHLGLSLEELARLDHFPNAVADLVEQYVDVERLLELCSTSRPTLPQEPTRQRGDWRIAVAQDEAFNFIYPENIRHLETYGEVRYFSPLRDEALPEGCNFVYLPGGYPEFYLEQLSRNTKMRTAITQYAKAGGYLLAECGGMMYLCRNIIDDQGKPYPMCGILGTEATMQDMRLSLGYRQLETKGGFGMRGHEFHYSRLTDPDMLPSVAVQQGARGQKVATPLYRYLNVIAGYTHLYWAEQNLLDLWDSTQEC